MTDRPTDTSTDCCAGGVSLLDSEHAGRLASQLGALAEPARLQMLSIIASSSTGEVCACDFVEPIGKSQPTISHHLKVLHEAGLVTGDKRGRWIWYRLTPGAVDSILTELTDSIPGTGSVS
jgi:ArsR family transcriptional regulator